ncbi:thiazole tautomerase TenI [Salipaludibacillus sp. HK11]|uniref:thiazole tautomerase TenI n=1 Tax=Salipaludibacillus sp. HK11 TaxID=3394320 RepID=UPI0039FCE416
MENKRVEFHIITDGLHSVEEIVNKVSLLAPYVDYIHLREKRKTAAELYKIINLLLDCGVPSSKIIVNDRVDVAKATNAAGVQLAYHSLDVPVVKKTYPEIRIGKSIHSLKEAKEAENEGADYLLFGHIYTSTCKPGKQPRGLLELAKIIEQVTVPVIVIGGIQPYHVKEILATGASGFAVMSGVFSSSNPVESVKAYQQQEL